MKIIKISALWCSACLIVNNNINKIKKEYENIEFLEYDYDFDEEEVSKYSVGDVLPVLIFIKDDIEKRRLVGESSYKLIKDTIRELE